MNHTADPSGAPQNTIGIFDSGVGGLSILQEIVRQLPGHDILYFADSGHVPYGDREAAEIQTFSEAIAAFLVSKGACVVVVACNTASAAALSFLRARFEVPIVGMEPAVKPAAEQSNNQHIGVIATRATFQGQLFASLVERFARDTQIHTQACPGLVEQVEAGLVDHPDTKALLRQYLIPLLDAGIDSLVLGCTHYPFLRPAIEEIVGPDVVVIDPAPAVARQTGRVLARSGQRCKKETGQVTYFTSGDPIRFQNMVYHLVDIPGPVRAVGWEGKEITSRC
jgi:glutamate racemase